MNKNSNFIKHIDFYFIDSICLIASFVIAYYFKFQDISINKPYLILLFTTVLFEFIICNFCQIFSDVLNRGDYLEFCATSKSLLINIICLTFFLFISKQTQVYSRIFIGVFYLLYLLLSYLIRLIYKRYIILKLKNSSKYSKNVLIITNNKNVKSNIEFIENSLINRIMGICLIGSKTKNNEIEGYKVVSDEISILNYISINHIDEIFIGIDINDLNKEIMQGIYNSRIVTRIVLPDGYDEFNHADFINNKMILSVGINDYSEIEVLLKRLFDIIGSISGIVIMCLLAIIISPIIYIKSPGKIFYSSERIGLNGKRFKMYKFRSMIPNAEELKENLRSKNIVTDGLMFKIEKDPRIIPGIGEFIRKTSIDEFPQFINVLKGDMSLVGTRPPTPDEWEKYNPEYRARMSIKPGITGLWQVSGRSNITNFDDVVKLDLEYIKNWTINLDFKIIAKTVLSIFDRNKGAF